MSWQSRKIRNMYVGSKQLEPITLGGGGHKGRLSWK